MELRGERARTFVRVRKLLGRGVVTTGDADELMADLAGLFGVQALAIVQDHRFDGWNVTRDVPAPWRALYMKYRAQDPSVELLAAAPRGETFVIQRDSSPAEKERDVFFHLHDQGFRDGMIASLHNPFVSDLSLAMYRTHGAKRFGDDEDELFRILYPHLAGGLAARRALWALQAKPDAVPGLRGQVTIGFPGHAVTWSQGARRLWRDTLAISSESGWRRAEHVLRESARRFNTPGSGRSQRVVPGIRVEWAYVPAKQGERWRMIGLVCVEHCEPAAATPAESLLTPRQRVVARRASDGLTAREIATELGIGTETVRWTLREIYRRLAVHSRTELGRLLGPAQRD